MKSLDQKLVGRSFFQIDIFNPEWLLKFLGRINICLIILFYILS